MAARDHKAFATFIAEDAVFFGNQALRGKAAVVEGWKGLYEKPDAPFSWRSESVEVLDSGKLAHSSGPVFNPKGERVGTFNSIWRRESDGSWKVVFDKGCDACKCAQPRAVVVNSRGARYSARPLFTQPERSQRTMSACTPTSAGSVRL